MNPTSSAGAESSSQPPTPSNPNSSAKAKAMADKGLAHLSAEDERESNRVRRWRHNVQRELLPTADHIRRRGILTPEVASTVDVWFKEIEAYDKMTTYSLTYSGIAKLMRHVHLLDDSCHIHDDSFHFRERARKLFSRWQAALKGGTMPNTLSSNAAPAPQATTDLPPTLPAVQAQPEPLSVAFTPTAVETAPTPNDVNQTVVRTEPVEEQPTHNADPAMKEGENQLHSSSGVPSSSGSLPGTFDQRTEEPAEFQLQESSSASAGELLTGPPLLSVDSSQPDAQKPQKVDAQSSAEAESADVNMPTSATLDLHDDENPRMNSAGGSKTPTLDDWDDGDEDEEPADVSGDEWVVIDVVTQMANVRVA